MPEQSRFGVSVSSERAGAAAAVPPWFAPPAVIIPTGGWPSRRRDGGPVRIWALTQAPTRKEVVSDGKPDRPRSCPDSSPAAAPGCGEPDAITRAPRFGGVGGFAQGCAAAAAGRRRRP